MLREEFLLPLEMSAQELAQRIHVPSRVIQSLVEEQGEITPDLALRLSRLFGTSVEFWLNGQLAWDLYHAMHASGAADMNKIIPLPLASPENP
jgi:addiction module HigA family antidote